MVSIAYAEQELSNQVVEIRTVRWLGRDKPYGMILLMPVFVLVSNPISIHVITCMTIWTLILKKVSSNTRHARTHA